MKKRTTRTTLNDDTGIGLEYLGKLNERNEFSGFDRQESVPIIRRLIKELRTTIVIAQSLAETVSNMDKEALTRASFEEQCG